jgi:hypothetical protein
VSSTLQLPDWPRFRCFSSAQLHVCRTAFPGFDETGPLYADTEVIADASRCSILAKWVAFANSANFIDQMRFSDSAIQLNLLGFAASAS